MLKDKKVTDTEFNIILDELDRYQALKDAVCLIPTKKSSKKTNRSQLQDIEKIKEKFGMSCTKSYKKDLQLIQSQIWEKKHKILSKYFKRQLNAQWKLQDLCSKSLRYLIVFVKNRRLIEVRFIFLCLFNRLNTPICNSSHIIYRGGKESSYIAIILKISTFKILQLIITLSCLHSCVLNFC